jgi:hypothetical protein
LFWLYVKAVIDYKGSSMTQDKRPQYQSAHIQPDALLKAVQNTAPFLFEALKPEGRKPQFSYIGVLNHPDEGLEYDLWNYFRLCIASHFATVGTFVPTDVDLSIRQKLWSNVHHVQGFEPMWKSVQEFHQWDESYVSKRFVVTASGKKLSGHQGEWFSIAMGAYGTALKVAHEFIPEVRESIEVQIDEHEAALTELRDDFASDPTVEKMKRYHAGVAAVAHNLGDLDRMFEAWEISDHDVLKRRVFRSGHEDARNPRPIFFEAGKIYQAMLANENHRHFALREPKGLRKSHEFLLNFGPFLDDWGSNLVKNGVESGLLTELDLREIIEALLTGWKKLNVKSIYTAQGYGRALYGIATALGGDKGFARGRVELENMVPPQVRRELLEGGLRTIFTVSKAQFEQQQMRKTLSLLQE